MVKGGGQREVSWGRGRYGRDSSQVNTEVDQRVDRLTDGRETSDQKKYDRRKISQNNGKRIKTSTREHPISMALSL